MIFWSIVLVVVAAVLFAAWRKDAKGKAMRSGNDCFGNHAEQRFLEEEHRVTVAPTVAGGREANEKGLGYWGESSNAGGYSGGGFGGMGGGN